MGLSIAQLPPLTPTSNENSFNTAADTDFKVLVKPPADAFVVVALTDSAKSRIVAKADSIDYFLADVMPTGIFSSYDDPPDFVDGVVTWVPELPAATIDAAVVPVAPPLAAAAAPPRPPPAASPEPPPLLPPPLLPPPARSCKAAAAAASAGSAAVAPDAPAAPPVKLASVGLRARTAVTGTDDEAAKGSPPRAHAAPSTPAAEALDAAAATFGRVPKVSVPASAAVAVAQAAAAAAMAGAPPPSLPPPKLGKRKAVDLQSIADVQERRRERRLAKNRATAAVSRERKHAQMQALAVTVYELQREGRKLGEQLAERDAEVRALRSRLAALGEEGKKAAASVPRPAVEEEMEATT